jgi:hypothetical protein
MVYEGAPAEDEEHAAFSREQTRTARILREVDAQPAWSPLGVADMSRLLREVPVRRWLSGGWAIDEFVTVGQATRDLLGPDGACRPPAARGARLESDSAATFLC